MEYFFLEENKGFYTSDVHSSIPKGAVEVSYDEYIQLLDKSSQGFTIKVVDGEVIALEDEVFSKSYIAEKEKSWVEKELLDVRDELELVQDSDPKATGNVGDWRNYRKELRLWNEANPNFPKQQYRPKSPRQ